MNVDLGTLKKDHVRIIKSSYLKTHLRGYEAQRFGTGSECWIRLRKQAMVIPLYLTCNHVYFSRLYRLSLSLAVTSREMKHQSYPALLTPSQNLPIYMILEYH